MMDIAVLIFLIAFQIKHLRMDYHMQTPYMYENKGKATGWIEPLALHASYHATATYGLLLVWHLYSENTMSWWMGLLIAGFDFITHFGVDRWKATQKDTPADKRFWLNLGWDQFWHHVVGLIIVFVTLSFF